MIGPKREQRRTLDTSTVILLRRIDSPAFLPEEPLITAITLAELTVEVDRGGRSCQTPAQGASAAGWDHVGLSWP